jgi:hypothetical protein
MVIGSRYAVFKDQTPTLAGASLDQDLAAAPEPEGPEN